MFVFLLLDFLDNTSSTIGASLSGNFDFSRVKSLRDDRVSASPHTFPHHPLNGSIPRPVHHGSEIFQLPTHSRFQKRANVSSPISRGDRETVDCAEDTDNTVSWNIIHSGDDDAMSVGKHMRLVICRPCRRLGLGI